MRKKYFDPNTSMSIKKIMKIQGKKYLKCPCCLSQISPSHLNILFKQVESLESKHAIWWARDADKILQNIDRFQWGCDTCLHSRKAIIATPEKQTFCDTPPYLVYFDKELTCSTCNKFFNFSAKEQFFWYETLKFWVQSEAKDCPACRKKARDLKKSNK